MVFRSEPFTLSSVPPSTFNGGLLQVNIGDVQTGGDYPLINALKTAQFWQLAGSSNPVTPDILDSNGYLTSVPVGSTGVFTVFFIPTTAERPGNWVVTWLGNGTISFNSGTIVSGSTTSSSGSGTFTFTPNTTRIVFGISAVGSPHITNIQVCHQDDVTALASGQVFTTKFLNTLKSIPFGVIRFLGWQFGNECNITTWATRPPLNYVMYGGVWLNNAIYAGATTNSGNDYSASLGGFALTDKAMVHVLYNADATTSGAVTLNVNSTGAINVLNEYSNAIGGYGPTGYPKANKLATLVYDATLNSWINFGGNTAVGNSGITCGMPYELMVQLCATVGAHPHFVAPQYAVDPMTDFIPNLAAYVRDNAPSWMHLHQELCNECWNTAGGFWQTQYAQNKATAYSVLDPVHWTASDFHNWHGKVGSTVGQALNAAFGSTTRYRCISGLQTASGGGGSDARLTASSYVNQTMAAQSGYTKTAASTWVTHVCCANYWYPAAHNTNQELIWAFAYVTGTTSVAASFIDGATGSATFSLPGCATLYSAIGTWANGLNVKNMVCYEGGYSPDYGNTDISSTITGASQASSCVLTLATTNFQGNSQSGNPAVIGMGVQITGNNNNSQTLNSPANATVTISNSTSFVTWTAHGFSSGQAICFTADFFGPVALPAPLTGLDVLQRQLFTVYYVKTVIDANNFTISATSGGSAITITGTVVGGATITGYPVYAVTNVSGNSVTINANTTGQTNLSTNGTATYLGSSNWCNVLRFAGKSVFSSPGNATGIQGYTTTNYRNFTGIGSFSYPVGFKADFPSVFLMTGLAPSNNVWSVLEDIYQTPLPPQWLAIQAWQGV